MTANYDYERHRKLNNAYYQQHKDEIKAKNKQRYHARRKAREEYVKSLLSPKAQARALRMYAQEVMHIKLPPIMPEPQQQQASSTVSVMPQSVSESY